ncbi:MAG: hypothetical protein R3C14_39320 [Caldilineaceae bacterium]
MLQPFGNNPNWLELFSHLYNALYFIWPPCLVFLLRSRRRVMARLITLWSVSGVISVLTVLANLGAISLLPHLAPEPQNTIILVSLRLALLVSLANLLVQRSESQGRLAR